MNFHGSIVFPARNQGKTAEIRIENERLRVENAALLARAEKAEAEQNRLAKILVQEHLHGHIDFEYGEELERYKRTARGEE